LAHPQAVTDMGRLCVLRDRSGLESFTFVALRHRFAMFGKKG
jgi:hypothetical protein